MPCYIPIIQCELDRCSCTQLYSREIESFYKCEANRIKIHHANLKSQIVQELQADFLSFVARPRLKIRYLADAAMPLLQKPYVNVNSCVCSRCATGDRRNGKSWPFVVSTRLRAPPRKSHLYALRSWLHFSCMGECQ